MDRLKSVKKSKIAQFSLLFPAFLLLAQCAAVVPKGQQGSYSRGCSLVKFWQTCPAVSSSGLPGVISPDVASFNGIHVSGPYNVAVYPNRGSRKVIVHGDASVIGRTHVYVREDGTLMIRADSNASYSNHNLATVDIRMGSLSRIYFDSPGKLVAKDIRATNLMVAAMHRAQVILTGAVRNLSVATYEKAKVDTSHLKVKKNLTGVATGESRVYHHGQPSNRNTYSQPNGAFVRMGGLHVPAECEGEHCASYGKKAKDLFTD